MCKIAIILIILTFSSFKWIECGIKVIADDRFLEECLSAHNKYRDLHENTQRLRLSRNATEYALNRIRSLAKIDGHRPVDNRGVFGENFYWYYDSQGYHSCQHAVDLWYKGYSRYDYNRPGFSDKTGGFSQVVWRGSQYVGCARCEDDTRNTFETYVVCNYSPAGNVDGQYPYNVYPLREQDRPTSGSSGSSGSISGSNEWTVERPGTTVQRPGSVSRPEVSGNRPINSNTWTVERPISEGVWTVQAPVRPIVQPQRPIVATPPSPPSYPLILLHPLIK